jgi:hypothetical protein
MAGYWAATTAALMVASRESLKAVQKVALMAAYWVASMA